MIIIGKPTSREAEQLKSTAIINARCRSHETIKNATIESMFYGGAFGVLIAMFILSIGGTLGQIVLPPIVLVLMCALVSYANVSATYTEEKYLEYPSAYKYHEATFGRTVIDERCHLHGNQGNLCVSVVDANGIIESKTVDTMKVVQKIGIKEVTVSLIDGLIYVPYKTNNV